MLGGVETDLFYNKVEGFRTTVQFFYDYFNEKN